MGGRCGEWHGGMNWSRRGGGLEGAVTTNTKVREVTQTMRDEQIIKREGK
jgi:hypothetical protein